MRMIKKGATSQSIYVSILDSASTTGGRKTGIVFNSAGLTAYYVRNKGLAVAITLATLVAADSAYSSGGFKEVDATNMPGIYRLDLPDAALATGVDSVAIVLRGATGMVQADSEIQLTAADLQDAVRAGLTALPNAAAGAATGLLTCTNANELPANAIVAASLAADAITDAKVAADVTIASVTGNVGGNVVGSVASVTTGVTLAASAVQAIWDALTTALTTVGSIGKLLVDNINATISSRLSSAGYTAPDNASIATILTRTDVATSTRAAAGDAMTLTVAGRQAVADSILGRRVNGGADGGRTVGHALAVLRNKVEITAGVLTVYDVDDTTVLFTAAVTTTAGNPISTIDPT